VRACVRACVRARAFLVRRVHVRARECTSTAAGADLHAQAQVRVHVHVRTDRGPRTADASEMGLGSEIPQSRPYTRREICECTAELLIIKGFRRF
jgi:hypothetical protein